MQNISKYFLSMTFHQLFNLTRCQGLTDNIYAVVSTDVSTLPPLDKDIRDKVTEMAHKVFLALAVLLASHSSQAKLQVVTDPSPVVVKAGEDVHLKCLLKAKQPVDLKDLVVQWFTRGTLVVEYDDKLTIDKPGMSMSIEALKTGDATLTITNATHEHSGNFRCYVYYDSNHIMKQTVLQVDDPNKPKNNDLRPVTSEELNKKLNKVLDWFLTFTGKLEELVSESKKCSAKP